MNSHDTPKPAGAEVPTETDHAVHEVLLRFASDLTKKMTALAAGEPEDQLRAPVEQLIRDAGEAIGRSIVVKGESALPGRLGIPDYAVLAEQSLIGYMELKAPGHGVQPARFKGHDQKQWQRFQTLPNLLYTDGHEWTLFRGGEQAHATVRLSADPAANGAKSINPEDAANLKALLFNFFSWQPIPPASAKELAELLAPLCRLLRDQVADALNHHDSPLQRVAADWRELLFPTANNHQFADAYAQTILYTLLLARAEESEVGDLHAAIRRLAKHHELLAKTLEVLTVEQARREIDPAIRTIQRLIAALDPQAIFAHGDDPWLYFYEDFLAAYDRDLRKDAGVYYTPVEVVRCQVRLTETLLRGPRIARPDGFADPNVLTLDPAVGTGTYLLGIIHHVLSRIEREEGAGAVASRATSLTRTLHGFEFMVGPYSVAKLRLNEAVLSRGGALPEPGLNVFLTDTLESPHADPDQARFGFLYEPMAREHRRALAVKNATPILVCLGNPPYDRHASVHEIGPERAGGWVRYADKDTDDESLEQRARRAIFGEMIARPASDAGHGGDLKNAYNLYVYFWTWALWKVFLSGNAPGPGVVTYITAASWLDGDAFVGLRQTMRQQCDAVWIIDLGGEGRGTRREENIFAIQTPVAIALAVRYGERADTDTPAAVHYTRIEGTAAQKREQLDAVHLFDDLPWETCPDTWQAPFRPAGKGDYFDWPLLTDLMPWQHSGVQAKRLWPISVDRETAERRWDALLQAPDRAIAFRETSDRRINGDYAELTSKRKLGTIESLGSNAPPPTIVSYAYRSLDRQVLMADGRLLSRPRPPLWQAHSERQVYLTSLFSYPLGFGPALTASANIPDLDHFRGSAGAKATIPLYRDAAAEAPNIAPGLLEALGDTLGRAVSPDDFVAYLYGVLAQPAFTERFAEELASRELRVPITTDPALFHEAVELGRRLLWLHTYGERMVPEGEQWGQVLRGEARCVAAVPGEAERYPDEFSYDEGSRTLHVGAGRFSPVSPAVYGYEVSGLKVVQSWLGYRMRRRAGKRSSPLDEIQPEQWTAPFTSELLNLLWILEHSLALHEQQAQLLERVVEGPLWSASSMPEVPQANRQPPRVQPQSGLWQSDADVT